MNASRALNAYQREAILSASPARLLTMLYDRLLLDLGRAEAAQLAEEWPTAHENLLHAQDILAELSASLQPELWTGADQLLGIYNYAGAALMNANIHRNVELTRECVALLEPLRATWHEAAGLPAAAAGVGQAS
ncbi:flagellar protein FliS (plasmid) [Arthrobacter sp. ERGS1:01]|uniref:flagellar export chaperone FliS n=1 Tax=Arthrobacter sp. ERGS1:01 TaxID=1704044 RepID=UPI0006B57878|nr:flagellar export chaperone FliS [Arthrobacter sp. ERGS1:01]ALE04199.1 flagellar protein FliS [Arthrobacter sp. ERGS1:01]